MQLNDSSSGCRDRSDQEKRTFPFPSVLLMRDAMFLPGDPVSPTDLPVIIIENDEAFITTAKSYLIVAVVPPVGERLTVHHITEDNHVPENTRNGCHCGCQGPKATRNMKQKQLLLLIFSYTVSYFI